MRYTEIAMSEGTLRDVIAKTYTECDTAYGNTPLQVIGDVWHNEKGRIRRWIVELAVVLSVTDTE